MFIPFVILLVIVIKGHIYMPVWTYFIALGFGAAAMLPLSAIYAISVRSLLGHPFSSYWTWRLIRRWLFFHAGFRCQGRLLQRADLRM